MKNTLVILKLTFENVSQSLVFDCFEKAKRVIELFNKKYPTGIFEISEATLNNSDFSALGDILVEKKIIEEICK